METNIKKTKEKFKSSLTARMIMVGLLILVLMIPLEFIKKLIVERQHRQGQAMVEINEQWGNEVLLYGPMLQVPYKTYKKIKYNNRVETQEEIKYAYFFPEKLNIDSKVNPEKKHRGIYTTAVYKTNIDITGQFSPLDFSDTDISPKDIEWDKAKIIVNTTNLKGVNNQVEINLNNHKYPFSSKYKANNHSYSTLHELQTKKLKLSDMPKDKNISFSISMDVNGSQQIRFIPIGKETTANIISNWKDANFDGEYLPYNSDKMNENGFNAKWKILDINRPFPQQAFGHMPDLRNYACGVNFEIPVDEYTKSERSTKYGLLVIGLTFLVFFLIQSISGIKIHPFQYMMIGLALTMFYTLLISISEHSNFFKAYLIAGIAVVALITLYSRSVLKHPKFSILVGVSLTVLYTFIFVIIQLKTYALLVGSIGLFIILALVMYASRKIDWENA